MHISLIKLKIALEAPVRECIDRGHPEDDGNQWERKLSCILYHQQREEVG